MTTNRTMTYLAKEDDRDVRKYVVDHTHAKLELRTREADLRVEALKLKRDELDVRVREITFLDKMYDMYGNDKDAFRSILASLPFARTSRTAFDSSKPQTDTDETAKEPEEKDAPFTDPNANTMPPEDEPDDNQAALSNARQGVGKLVQMYNKTDLTTVVKVFDGIWEAVRYVNGSFVDIKNAAKHKTIYKECR
jgi:hypothetical protein